MSIGRPNWTATLIAALALAGSVGFANAAESESAVARGGRLYDKWFTENKAAKPTGDHPAYTVKDGKYGKDTSWRCKECHGWDYLGKDGAYAKGGHATGIKGIRAAKGKDPATIAAMLRDKTHGYTAAQLSDKDASDLALVRVSRPGGHRSSTRGRRTRSRATATRARSTTTPCAPAATALDGKKLKDAPPLGSVADNGAEMMHKVLNGQPGEAMPACGRLTHRSPPTSRCT
jgi:hypothetical protein